MIWQKVIKKILFSFTLVIIFFGGGFGNHLSAANLSDAFSDDQLGMTGQYAGYNVQSDSLEGTIGRILIAAFSLLGIIFISLLVYGGYLWMTDRGNDEQVNKAKKIITAAVIGLIIVVASYAISYFVINSFSKTL